MLTVGLLGCADHALSVGVEVIRISQSQDGYSDYGRYEDY